MGEFVKKTGTPDEHGTIVTILGAEGPGTAHARPRSISEEAHDHLERNVLAQICDNFDQMHRLDPPVVCPSFGHLESNPNLSV